MSPSTPNIDAIQAALRQQKIDGWLFYDILHRDPIAYRVFGDWASCAWLSAVGST